MLVCTLLVSMLALAWRARALHPPRPDYDACAPKPGAAVQVASSLFVCRVAPLPATHSQNLFTPCAIESFNRDCTYALAPA